MCSVRCHAGPGERLASEYRAALGAGDYAHAFAVANERLDELASAERRSRWIRGIAGGLLVVGSAAGIAGSELSVESAATRLDVRTFGGAVGLIGVVGLASAFLIESPIARLTTVWRRDPSLVHIQPTVSPIQGGATIGLVGRF